ncbi:MAG: diphthamide synthesis protein, partial [Nanoarchaeota archaeon]|nr:diphthamide synthesis protein [Nanoarchaeota archaeon]
LTTKPGQMILTKAEEIKKKLEEKGKRAYILVMNQITPEKILGIDVDVLINCACPRMDEDFALFKKPILNPEDVDKI